MGSNIRNQGVLSMTHRDKTQHIPVTDSRWRIHQMPSEKNEKWESYPDALSRSAVGARGAHGAITRRSDADARSAQSSVALWRQVTQLSFIHYLFIYLPLIRSLSLTQSHTRGRRAWWRRQVSPLVRKNDAQK